MCAFHLLLCSSKVDTTLEPCPVLDKVKNIDFKNLGQQIASMTPFLLGGGGGVGLPTNSAEEVAHDGLKTSTTQFTDMINRIAAMKQQSPAAPETTVASSVTVTASAQEDLQRLEKIVDAALARAQVFLDNDAARRALGGTSLQTFVYQSEVNLESNYVAAFYMDSASGTKAF